MPEKAGVRLLLACLAEVLRPSRPARPRSVRGYSARQRRLFRAMSVRAASGPHVPAA
jgi:hypothetical protein